MFNNQYKNSENPPPNYYPNDNAFFNEIQSHNDNNPMNNSYSKNNNFTNNFSLEKLLPMFNSNANPLELIKALGAQNPKLSQILGLLGSLQNNNVKTKKITALKSDCKKYVLVKDYYKDDKNE